MSMRGLKSTLKAMHRHTWNSSLTTVKINDQMFIMTFDKRQKCDKSVHMHTHTHVHTRTHTQYLVLKREVNLEHGLKWMKLEVTVRNEMN